MSRRYTTAELMAAIMNLRQITLQGFAGLSGDMHRGYAKMDGCFESMDAGFESLEETMNRRFDALEMRFDAFERRTQILERRRARA